VSSLHFPLLRLLADGEFHSMQALGAALGIAPESIRAHAAGLERLGLAITADERGVRLSEPCELIDGAQVCARLQARPTPIAVEITDQCASTNTELMQRARNGAAEHAFALACELQTGGRGRRGKSWRSGIGTDLTFSLLWRFTQGAGALSGLSLAVGVALARALDRAGYPGVQLKWPNDLVLRGRKLGGILIEVAGDSLGPSAVVVGVGINVHWSAARAEGLDQPFQGRAARGGARGARLGAGGILPLRVRRVSHRMAGAPRLAGQAGDAAHRRTRSGRRRGDGRR